jgi:hypothetical protein
LCFSFCETYSFLSCSILKAQIRLRFGNLSGLQAAPCLDFHWVFQPIVLDEILLLLPTSFAVLQFRVVCKRFRAMVDDKRLLLPLCRRFFPKLFGIAESRLSAMVGWAVRQWFIGHVNLKKQRLAQLVHGITLKS